MVLLLMFHWKLHNCNLHYHCNIGCEPISIYNINNRYQIPETNESR